MLTRRQRDCLEAIDAHLVETGRSPSVREIAVRIRAKSPNIVQGLLRGLEERGFISREPQRRYGIERIRRLQFFKFNEERKELEPLRSK